MSKREGIFVQNELRKESNNTVHSLETLFLNTDSQNSTKIRWNTKRDLALLPFSSGTTGLPKGIMLSHHNFVSLLQILHQPSKFDFPAAGEHMVSALPFYHIYGSVMLFRSLEIGSTMWTMSKFQKELYLKIIQDNKVPVIFVVPPILNYLAKADEVKNYDLSCVRTCLSGAAPAGKQLVFELESRHPNMHVLQDRLGLIGLRRAGYGMTEMSGVSHIMPKYTPKGQKRGSCGMLIPNYETKIVNDETGEELGYNQVGEICVKSQTCMLGYYNNEKATKDIYDKENFLHTGDLGYYDNEGYLYIVDRLKELIKVRGFQVAPAELEDILLSHIGIKDAAVIGIPDATDCEIPKAFVVLKDDFKVDRAELINFVNCKEPSMLVKTKLIHYKHLKGGVEFVKEIPKSPSGKILRRLLRQSTTMSRESRDS
uniref:Uncharacterized protein n=1 Tax=Romanomermis culicivorax TaxID=13658 RepID=A0A915I3S7_ROMCU